MSKNLHIKITKFMMPKAMLKFILYIIGKKELNSKPVSNLQVNDDYTRQLLNWQPIAEPLELNV